MVGVGNQICADLWGWAPLAERPPSPSLPAGRGLEAPAGALALLSCRRLGPVSALQHGAGLCCLQVAESCQAPRAGRAELSRQRACRLAWHCRARSEFSCLVSVAQLPDAIPQYAFQPRHRPARCLPRLVRCRIRISIACVESLPSLTEILCWGRRDRGSGERGCWFRQLSLMMQKLLLSLPLPPCSDTGRPAHKKRSGERDGC